MDEVDQKQSSIANPSIQEIQKDILIFKDEVLRDIRKLELQMKSRVEKNINEVEKKVILNESQSNELNSKLNALSTLVSLNTSKMDKIEKISATQTKLEEKLMNNEVKMNSAIRDLSDTCFKYDKMYLNNLVVPGFIGDHCKYPNLKEYIQWLNTQLSTFNSFKDKQLMDLKAYKTKLDGLIDTFQNSIERVKGNFVEYCAQCVNECETRFKQRIQVTEDLIEGLRTENSTHALMLRNEALRLKVDWEKMMGLKEEVMHKMNQEVEDFKTAGKKNIEGCASFQKEFQLIKIKFTELSEFIRDVRFRRGMDVKRTEFWEMSKKINFNLKKNHALSPEEIIKAEDASELQTTNNNKEVKRRDSKCLTEVIRNTIDSKELTDDKEREISKAKTIKFFDKDKRSSKEKEHKKSKTILLKKKEKAKNSNSEKSLTDLSITPNEDIKELMSVPLTPLLSSIKIKQPFVASTSSPIKLNESKDNIEPTTTHRDTKLLSFPLKKDLPLLQLRDHKNKSANMNPNHTRKALNGNGNGINIFTNNKAITPNTTSIDHPVYTKNTSDNALSQDPNEYGGDHTKDFSCSTKLGPAPNKSELVKTEEMTQKSIDDKGNSTKVSNKLFEIEIRLGKIEESSEKKLESIYLQVKKFIDHFNEEIYKNGTNIKYLHSGFFVPMAFDEKNIMSYYPDKTQRILNQSKSQILNKKQFLRKLPTKGKQNNHTYSSLSVLLTNIPKTTQAAGSNVLLNCVNHYNEKDKQV